MLPLASTILSQRREYEYDYPQTSLLVELSLLYKNINKDERYTHAPLVTDPLHERYLKSSYAIFQRLIAHRLKEDPVQAYVELKRLHRRETTKLAALLDQATRVGEGVAKAGLVAAKRHVADHQRAPHGTRDH